jgi:hypothetical protein
VVLWGWQLMVCLLLYCLLLYCLLLYSLLLYCLLWYCLLAALPLHDVSAVHCVRVV